MKKDVQAIVALMGETGAGKTTLSIAIGDDLAPGSVLYIDASPDQGLTRLLAPSHPPLTVGQLFNRPEDSTSTATGTREAIDWVFSDLTVPVGDDRDLITIGALDDVLEIAEREKLRYGLTRLLANYDYAILDGYHALLWHLLPEQSLRPLVVLNSAQLSFWRPEHFPLPGITPAFVLNRYGDEPFPPALENALLHGQAVLIGKLPRYPTHEDCIRRLPEDFSNCLLRLNIPLTPS